MKRALALLLLLGCGSRTSELASAKAWPEADALMRGSSTWRGGDAAYSAPLSDGRVLWLFGDSFVGSGDETQGRGGREMVRNTVGIQTGPDPASASMEFFGGDGPTDPFFPSEGPLFRWPGPASAVGSGLLLTFVRLRDVHTGLGFETADSKALRVASTAGDPNAWTFTPVELPTAPPGVQLGFGAHLQADRWLYTYAPVEPGNHDVYLGRWPVADVERGDLSTMRWWSGEDWNDDPRSARPVAPGVQTEFSVSPVGETLWMVSTQSFGSSDIVVRTATRPEGPWSKPQVLHRPREYGREGVLIYSAKVHPHLGGAPVVLTYCTNRTDFWDLAGDMSVYFPRFVRVTPR